MRYNDVMSNKADLFVDAYIANRFNGTKAAMEVFDIRSKKDPENTAAAIAYEYLRKPQISAKIKARLEDAEMGQEFVLKHLKRIAEDIDHPSHSMQALDRIAHFLGIEIA